MHQLLVSNHKSIKRLIDTILVPYVSRMKDHLGLSKSKKSFLLPDAFRAHRTTDELEKVKVANFVLSFIPANCSGDVQPVDVSVNSLYKSYLKEEFIQWYFGRVTDAIKGALHRLTHAQ